MQQAGATLRCGVWASHCGGFSCCGARALGIWASIVVAHRLSSCGSRALEHRLSSWGAWALLLCCMWGLPGPGLKPVSPALAGRFLTTVPPGKPRVVYSFYMPLFHLIVIKTLRPNMPLYHYEIFILEKEGRDICRREQDTIRLRLAYSLDITYINLNKRWR